MYPGANIFITMESIVRKYVKLPEGHMAAGCGWGCFSDQTVQREWVCKEGVAAAAESVVESETEVGMAQTEQW